MTKHGLNQAVVGYLSLVCGCPTKIFLCSVLLLMTLWEHTVVPAFLGSVETL